MGTNSFSIKQALGFGFEKWRENFWFLLGVTLFVFLVPALPGIVASHYFGIPEKGTQISTLFVHFVHAILRIAFHLGFINTALKMSDNKRGQFSDLFSNIRYFFPFLVSSLLLGIMVLVGMLLFIIPGLIVAVRFYLFGYAMIDKGLGPMASLKESATITSGQVFHRFLFSLVLMLINVAGILLLGFGLLASVPISALATAHIYRQLQGETERGAQSSISSLHP